MPGSCSGEGSCTVPALTGVRWVAWNMATVKKLCADNCRGRRDLLDDLFAECLDRADRVMANFDPDKGTLEAHMKSSLKWYVWKFLNRHARAKSLGKICAGSLPYDPDLERRSVRDREVERMEHREELDVVMSQLTEREQELLVMRDAREMTFQEIADELGVSKYQAREGYRRALDKAQAIARGEEEFEERWREAQLSLHVERGGTGVVRRLAG